MTPEQADQRLKQWATENGLDLEFITELDGWPSTDWEFEDTVTDLDHALNDLREDVKTPLPPDLMAFRISLWADVEIGIDHPLVVHNVKWRDQLMDLDYDNHDPLIIKELMVILKNTLKPEHFEGVYDQLSYALSTSPDNKLTEAYILEGHFMVGIVDDTYAAIVNNDVFRVYNIDTAKREPDMETDSILHMIKQSPKSVVEPEQLASVVGNELAGILLPPEGDISALDLP